ncbi:putative fatty acyl-CoA reductase CG5065 [Zophobas morio]|uniref:putative fatty acyl-CoA reductase CG5065 n=1 Tax=Zophobas morio TaxID=2755281 RepID=UPI0030832E80
MVQIHDNSEPNRVADFFANKTIFITGGSGFLGKVLIEKLLRSCTQLKKLYVLMRPKKGRTATERLHQIFDGPLYDLLKKQHGKDIFDKVEVIIGDIEAQDLGFSAEDRKKLTEEVEIIYHSAATVQFDEDFRKSILLNVRGAKLLLALAKECKNLVAYCHLSTAYCQEQEEVLYEKCYPPPADPHRVIEMCEWMSDTTLDSIAQKIRGSHANTYTFTKALGEALVAEQMDNLPVIIQRPSAVIPIWIEPLPGWTDNLNGPTGLLLGAGKGVIRTMYGRSDYFADYCPVDSTANCLICSTYDYATYKKRRVYNFTASDEVKVTFKELIDVGRRIVTNELPFDWTLWYPGGGITHSRIRHALVFFFFQLVPAIFIDAILFVFGFKPIMVRVQKKILRGYKIFEYYSNRKWDFRKDNIAVTRSLMNKKENQIFKIDPEGFVLRDYIYTCILGSRRYLLKEKDENIPVAKRRLKVLWAIDKMYKCILVAGILYVLFKMFIMPFV